MDIVTVDIITSKVHGIDNRSDDKALPSSLKSIDLVVENNSR